MDKDLCTLSSFHYCWTETFLSVTGDFLGSYSYSKVISTLTGKSIRLCIFYFSTRERFPLSLTFIQRIIQFQSSPRPRGLICKSLHYRREKRRSSEIIPRIRVTLNTQRNDMVLLDFAILSSRKGNKWCHMTCHSCRVILTF